jgi:hypothetical protein
MSGDLRVRVVLGCPYRSRPSGQYRDRGPFHQALPEIAQSTSFGNASQTRAENGRKTLPLFFGMQTVVAKFVSLYKISAAGGEVKMPFEINDALLFEENLTAFAKSLEADDLKLAAVLAQKFPELLNGRIQQSDVWDALETASREQAA